MEYTVQHCKKCGLVLDRAELEVGTGYCHACGHATYAARYEGLGEGVKELWRRLTAHREGESNDPTKQP